MPRRWCRGRAVRTCARSAGGGAASAQQTSSRDVAFVCWAGCTSLEYRIESQDRLAWVPPLPSRKKYISDGFCVVESLHPHCSYISLSAVILRSVDPHAQPLPSPISPPHLVSPRLSESHHIAEHRRIAPSCFHTYTTPPFEYHPHNPSSNVHGESMQPMQYMPLQASSYISGSFDPQPECITPLSICGRILGRTACPLGLRPV